MEGAWRRGDSTPPANSPPLPATFEVPFVVPHPATDPHATSRSTVATHRCLIGLLEVLSSLLSPYVGLSGAFARLGGVAAGIRAWPVGSWRPRACASGAPRSGYGGSAGQSPRSIALSRRR